MIAAMIKSAIVLAAAAFVASLMKRQSAAVRHAVWTAGLIGAMAIPLFSLTLPSWQTSLAGPALAMLAVVNRSSRDRSSVRYRIVDRGSSCRNSASSV